ncbi:hypothetical protein FT663_00146 [Candidozyma haemuli var. vulneris]|nr:hypothetical protein FT662_00045 [[Candida] haemuloni var. vulneris]KAF3995724.1 hypothetical protein FT663_00146 [[Candida] haemuloni var. vulneris]
MSIAEILPQGEYSLVHVRSRAFQTKPLAMSAHHPKTLKAKHFFLLVESSSRCPVLALEIYVYLTFENDSLKQHIFVPKADTSGLGDRRINVAAVVQVLLDRIIQTNPGSYLSEPVAWRKDETEKEKTQTSSPYPTVNILQTIAAKLKADPTALEKLPYYGKAHHTTAPDTAPPAATATTKVSLFTRSANAYIFPNSELNSGKHVADGNALFSWWVRILENTLRGPWRCMGDLPGAEAAAVNRYLPSQRWTRGHIFKEDAQAVREVPVFPDDPKGRFLEHLVVEGRYRSVTVKEFWEELGYRQEFRLGNVVGIIGCENGDSVSVDRSKPPPGTPVSHKQYKKIVDFVKGEDYNAKTDIQAMTESGLPEVFSQCGVEYEPLKVRGTSAPREVAAKKIAQVNTLTARKRPAVNNLTGLVRKAPKAP